MTTERKSLKEDAYFFSHPMYHLCMCAVCVCVFSDTSWEVEEKESMCAPMRVCMCVCAVCTEHVTVIHLLPVQVGSVNVSACACHLSNVCLCVPHLCDIRIQLSHLFIIINCPDRIVSDFENRTRIHSTRRCLFNER